VSTLLYSLFSFSLFGGVPIPAARPAAAAARFHAALLVRTLEVFIGTMEQQHRKPSASAAASSPASSGSPSSARSIHGSMSSAFLGVSSSTRSQSQSQSQSQLRRSSPSLYPPPAPLPGHLASRGSAATTGGRGSASGLSSSQPQFHRISPSPGTAAAKRRPRPNSRITHSLPSPFLSELSSIRRMGTNVFGDLNATQRPLLRGQQQQEMTRSSSSLTMPQSHHHTPIPIGGFSGFPSASQRQQALAMGGLSGFAPLPLQQQQAQPSFCSLHPLPGGNLSVFPLPASQTQNMQPSSSSSTDLPSRIFSEFEQPPASQHFSTIFQSSSTSSDIHELPPLPESLQMPPLLSQQVIEQQPVVVAPCLEPEIISLDHGDELSALVNSFASSHGLGSTSLPTNLEDRLQLGGSGSGLSMRGAAEGGSQTWETPAGVHDKVNNGSGSSSSSSIPWNCDGSKPMYSQSEERALQELSDLLSLWPSSASSSCNQSMGSSVAGSCQGWADMAALANKMDMMNIGGSSCSAGPKMPWNYSSLPTENSTSVPHVPKLILGGMDRPGLPPRPPVLGAGASRSMSRRGRTKEQYFSDAEIEKINKDNRLKELVKTDSKRAKR